MGGLLPTPIVVVLAATLVLGLIDVFWFKIPNLLILPFLLAGFVYQGVGAGLSGLTDSLLGMLFGFAILVPFYVVGGIGGGDVKLLAAIGAWLGPWLTFAVFVASSLVAGLYALVLVLACGRGRETWANLQQACFLATPRNAAGAEQVEAVLKRRERGRAVPFAASVALGVVVLVLWCRLC